MQKDYAETRGALLRDLDGLSVEVDAEARIGTLWLDRPPLNIVSYHAREQICAIIEEFDRDDDVGVVVIRGKGGVFTSGGDVKAFPDIPPNGMSDLADNIAAPERCSKPVIAAIEKYCFGVGFELALACDFRLATADSLVALPESAIGQMPGSGGGVRAVRMIGLTRAKDMIITGGENVFCPEVENALYRHPMILEAAVIGVPDDTWGETVKAVVVRQPGAEVTAEQLIAHCHEWIAGFKCPRTVDFAEELPKSGAGKILKSELRKPFWEGKDRAVN